MAKPNATMQATPPQNRLFSALKNRVLKTKGLGLILLLAGVLGGAKAAEISNFYQIEVPVRTTQAQERNDAFIKAFSDLLVRVTGNEKVLAHPSVQTAFSNVERVVSQYRYLPSGDTFLLQVNFNQPLVLELLKASGVPLWGSNRPSVLVWLFKTDQNKSVHLMGNEENTEFWKPFAFETKKRGVPVILPLADLPDLEALPPEVLKISEIPAVEKASLRYGAEKIIVGHLKEEGGIKKIEGLFINGEQSEAWSESGLTEPEVLERFAASISVKLSKMTLPNEHQMIAQSYLLTLTRIQNAKDLEDARAALTKVPSVLGLTLKEVSEEAVQVEVSFTGDLSLLKQNLSEENRLAIIKDANAAESLIYEWVP